MDTHKLASFVDLAQTLSYTETAARRFTTQATISKQIKSLEQSLDVQLIDRSHRTIKLTTEGQLVLPYAQQIVETAHHMQTRLQAQRAQAKKRLVIRTIPSVAQYRAFNAIAAFSKQHPEIELNFAEAETTTLVADLDAGKTDIIFTRLFDQPPAKYQVLDEEKDHFVALFPADHPKAQASSVSIQDLANESLLLLSPETGLSKPVLDLMQAAAITPTIGYTGQRIDLVAGMVNRGMGVAIMMGKSVPLNAYANIRAVPITPQITSRLAFMCLKTTPAPAVATFWQFIKTHATPD
ncbi:LysR family transcriptional regulator [Lacticaseibacillus sp. GG6-2]